jgi:UDP-glucose 4-epimerase
VNILVLGGCGFIGSRVVDELCKNGNAVTVFDKVEPKYANDAARYICGYDDGNWNSASALAAALRGQDVVMHLIGNPARANGDISSDIIANIAPSVRLFEMCAQAGVKQVMFASSGGAVYGEVRNLPIWENRPPCPVSVNGASKLAIENYLRIICKQGGMKYTILRIANPYGERQDPLSGVGAVASFAYKLLNNRPVTIFGDGSIIRDYVYVGDVARAFRLALDKQGVFNIGTGLGLTLTELVYSISGRLGIAVPAIEYLPARYFDVRANTLDNRLAYYELGWQPETNLAHGIEKTVGWIREHYNVIA